MIKEFNFNGVIPASKSCMNRALICASFKDEVILQGSSSCDDVVKMQEALSQLKLNMGIYDCGSAGTVLRFLALRVSRKPGVHILKGTPRLLARPQNDLAKILNQLGVQIDFQTDRLIISSPNGWRLANKTLKVNRQSSSQFASAILLNAWDLDFPLHIEWESETQVSEGYFQMTKQMVKDFGMDLIESPSGLQIPKNSKVKAQSYRIESDLSSAFAIAAYAALNGDATFKDFPFQSLQPDHVFVDILKAMGAGVEKTDSSVRVFKKYKDKQFLRGVTWNINDCPDLFPVLATLCAFAAGPSKLYGAPHLVHKESNRIQKTAEILKMIHVPHKILPDGIEILPNENISLITQAQFKFNTDHDHRLAFAAALIASQNFPIVIEHPEVVNKSFPEFWDIINKENDPTTKVG